MRPSGSVPTAALLIDRSKIGDLWIFPIMSSPASRMRARCEELKREQEISSKFEVEQFVRPRGIFRALWHLEGPPEPVLSKLERG
jgi:hypothetical protein